MIYVITLLFVLISVRCNMKFFNTRIGYVSGRAMLYSLLLFAACDDSDDVREIYLEGEPVAGIEISFPMGFFDQEPLMPKVSPDGKTLLFTGPESLPDWKGLWVMDLETQQKTLLNQSGRLGDWSPDGEWIVFNIGTQVYKTKRDGSELTQLTFDGRNFFPDWSPDGESIVISGQAFTTIINVEGDIIQFLDGAGGMPDWKANSKSIIGFKGFSSTSIWKQLTVYDLNQDKVIQVLDAAKGQDNRYPRASPDGSKIAFWNVTGIYIGSDDGLELKRIIPSHLNSTYHGKKKIYCNSPSWYPDGNHIVYDNFQITDYTHTSQGTQVAGVIRFYKVNVSEALAGSNL